MLAYFDVVVRSKLGWTLEEIQINQGNNIVIAFDNDKKHYLFRVPKYGSQQLQRYRKAAESISTKPSIIQMLFLA